MSAHVVNNSGNDEWYTPIKYIESARNVMGGIDTDPASNDIAQLAVMAETYYTKERSGLDYLWSGRVWMNPPYSASLIGGFCDHLVMCRNIGMVSEFITLTNNATDTRWFSSLMTVGNVLCLVKGRIKFLTPDGNFRKTPLQGQCFVYSGTNIDAFVREFSQYGVLTYK